MGRIFNKKKIVKNEARDCYGLLLNYTKFYLTSNHHDAEDLVTEAYEKFFKSYDKGTSNYKVGTNILGYLKLIVKNLYIDKKRKEKRSPNVIALHRKIDGEEVTNFNEYEAQKLEKDEESLKDPYALLIDYKKTKRLMNELLSEEDNEILYLRYVEKYKYSEIAKKLKIAQGTIGSRINRNKKRIEQELNKTNVINFKENKNEN